MMVQKPCCCWNQRDSEFPSIKAE